MHTTPDTEASRAYGHVMNAVGQVSSADSYRMVEFRADVESTVSRAKRAGKRAPHEIGRALIDAGVYPVRDYFAGRTTMAEKCGGAGQ